MIEPDFVAEEREWGFFLTCKNKKAEKALLMFLMPDKPNIHDGVDGDLATVDITFVDATVIAAELDRQGFVVQIIGETYS